MKPSPHHSTLNRPGVRLSKALRARQHDYVAVHERPASLVLTYSSLCSSQHSAGNHSDLCLK